MADGGAVSDDALMARVAADDAAAFATLVKRHEPAILRYLRHALPDAHEARDVCQDVFLEAWRRRHAYEPRGVFVAWLFRIARSRATSRGRFHAVRRLFVARSQVDEGGTGPRPDDAYEDRVTASHLHAALKQLPDTMREAVALRHAAELDHRTIASILGVDEATARQRSSRGLALLRQRLTRAEQP